MTTSVGDAVGSGATVGRSASAVLFSASSFFSLEKHKKDQETRIVSARPARRIRGLVLTLAAILIAVIAAVAVITLPKRSGAQELAEALELGEKYLSELNYEQAIAS